MTRLLKLLAPATIILSVIGTIAYDAKAESKCYKTTTYENVNGNMVIRVVKVCEELSK